MFLGQLSSMTTIYSKNRFKVQEQSNKLQWNSTLKSSIKTRSWQIPLKSKIIKSWRMTSRCICTDKTLTGWYSPISLLADLIFWWRACVYSYVTKPWNKGSRKMTQQMFCERTHLGFSIRSLKILILGFWLCGVFYVFLFLRCFLDFFLCFCLLML